MLVYTRDIAIKTSPDPIGGGGEGKVYAIPSRPEMLAKIFLKREEGRQAKLEELIANPFPAAGWLFAWPEELLFDAPGKTGRFVGYLMKRVADGISLSEFIDPGAAEYRERAFRVRLAIAVAEIFAEVRRHHLMIVVGDVSPRNLLVNARRQIPRITLIDLDSVQITTVGGRTYRSRAFTPYYTPPELIDGPGADSDTDCDIVDKDIGKEDRGPEHDRFGLAVIIFQILFDGWHPFAAVGAEPLEERLLAGRWPYTAGLAYRPPPQAPPMGDFPLEIQELFRRAFETGHGNPKARPTEDEWFDALTRHRMALAAIGEPKPPEAPVLALPPTLVRRPRIGKAAWAAAAAAVLVVALGLTLPIRLGGGTNMVMPTPHVAPLPPTPHAAPPPPKPPKPPDIWGRRVSWNLKWDSETLRLFDLLEDDLPAAIRDPQAAVAVCIEEQVNREQRTFSNFEYLVRRGDALEAYFTKILEAGRRVDELIEEDRAKFPRSHLPRPKQNVRLAVAVRPQVDPRAFDGVADQEDRCLFRGEFDKVLSDFLPELRISNGCLHRHFHHPDFPDPDPGRCYRSNFREAIEDAVRLQQKIRERLRLSPMRPTNINEVGGYPKHPELPRLRALSTKPPPWHDGPAGG